MNLNGLHLLLTYQCILECDHCFVWGGPGQNGTFTLEQIDEVLRQARDLGSVEWIYYEGGEPFLYYATLLAGVRAAHAKSFRVGIVSNAYWATSLPDARAALQPFIGLIEDLTVSSDCYHWDTKLSHQSQIAQAAAGELGIPFGMIQVAPAGEVATDDEGTLMFRGRATHKLAPLVKGHPWELLTRCPYEDLRDPGRVHVDPLGNLHLCQGLVLGNLFTTPLRQIVAEYQSEAHPIAGPLLEGGPAALLQRYELPLEGVYADACHLCYTARQALRKQFPDILKPDQMYGGA
jgi:MoaA/NifB/PqqE/SkfB family radical SAM enzyme